MLKSRPIISRNWRDLFSQPCLASEIMLPSFREALDDKVTENSDLAQSSTVLGGYA
jgi:hypothetical protein